MEYVWRNRTRPERERLEIRGKACRRSAREAAKLYDEYEHHGLGLSLAAHRVAALRSAEWAEERARAIAMQREDVLATCNERWRTVACGCKRVEIQVGCDQPQLCGRCRKRHAAKWWRRIATGMERALRSERSQWHNTPSHRRRGMLPGIYLITLTAPHSGDMASDRERIGRAVRTLLKHANKRDWWRTYALTWEATGDTVREHENGVTDGKGHVHVHLAVVSSWVPYTTENVAAMLGPRQKGERRKARRGLHEVWMDAVPGAIQPDVSPPKRDRDQAQSAGHYLAKYVTKGVDPSEFSGAKAGELLCAFRNRRKVSTSKGFWHDEPPTCGECAQGYRTLDAPCSLQDIAPGAVLRSHVARRMWLGIQERFPPWMRREVHPPPLVVEARADKRNAPSRWVLPDTPVAEWAEPVPLQGWKPQHFERGGHLEIASAFRTPMSDARTSVVGCGDGFELNSREGFAHSSEGKTNGSRARVAPRLRHAGGGGKGQAPSAAADSACRLSDRGEAAFLDARGRGVPR